MNLYLLDTDTLTLTRHHNPVVLTAISHRQNAGHTVALPIISIEEQSGGWLNALRAARTVAQQAQAYRAFAEAVPVWAMFRTLPMTESAIAQFEQLVRMKLNVGRMDLRIAAITLTTGATVITRNQRDFQRVPALAAEDWSIPLAANH